MKLTPFQTPFPYGYDFQSRMTSLGDTDGAIFAYAFDGEGNRIRQDFYGCLSTRFVYDGANAVVEMSAEGGSAYGGNVSNEVVWAWIHGPGLDQPVERIAFINGEARNRQVVHADGLGSVSALTDENGETVQTYAYAAFGGIREQTGTDLNRVTFTAREALGDSLGLFYYRHRIYDPHTGRFTSEDPLGFVDGANRYVYVGNDPVNFMDPLGLDALYLYGPNPYRDNSHFFFVQAVNHSKKYSGNVSIYPLSEASKAFSDMKNLDTIVYFGHSSDSRGADLLSMSTANITEDAQIYIYGCETAVDKYGDSSAQRWADHFQRPVVGTTEGLSFGLPINGRDYMPGYLRGEGSVMPVDTQTVKPH